MATATETWLERDLELNTELQDGTTPQQWIDQGFGYKAHQAWFAAGGFDPVRVKELVDDGFDADEVARRITEFEQDVFNLSYSGYSIAYMFCNGDLSIEQVRRMVGNDA